MTSGCDMSVVYMKMKSLTCVWLCDPMDCIAHQAPPWGFPGKSTGVGCHLLLQGIFPTQVLNQGLLHCRQTLDHLSHQVYMRELIHPKMSGQKQCLQWGKWHYQRNSGQSITQYCFYLPGTVRLPVHLRKPPCQFFSCSYFFVWS